MSKILRLEAVAVAIALIAALWAIQPSMWLIVLVLILPDVSMAGYSVGPQFGAKAYNAAHSYIGPIFMGLAASYFGSDLWLHIGAIWALHIAADRALGYGLKSSAGFGVTHLGRIGK